MKDKILEIIKQYPKHVAVKVLKNDELLDYINLNKKITSENFSEIVYSVIHDETNICPTGNTKRFISIKDGFGFCGKANKCQCCKESVSNAVSKSKQEYTEEVKESINEKRKLTILEKSNGLYSNNGQSPLAINSRKIYFENNKDDYIEKVKSTKLCKYGNENYNNSNKTKLTVKEKYGIDNVVHLSQVNQNPNLDIVKDRTLIEQQLINFNYSVLNMSKYLNLSITTVHKYLQIHGITHPKKSYAEYEIIEFLKSIGINSIQHTNRTILNGKEIDIYLPEQNFGIEYNGSYWHSELNGKDKNYHLNKTKLCKEKNLTLLHIWDHEWIEKTELIKSRIKSHLGLNQKVFARNTIVKVVSNKDTIDFLNTNHIQGSCPSSVNLGLYKDNQLIALMTFGKSRYNKKYNWELLRYCSSMNINVTGGASKLLSYFRNNNNGSIISYCDVMRNKGSLYSQLGFSKLHDSPPSYYYTKDYITFENRVKYQKHKLANLLENYDSNLSEWDNMQANGYDRIWDCGTSVWELK